MFWIRYTTTDGGQVEETLQPAPTEIEYPERRLYTATTTQDGAVVVQRPLRDSRPRKWVWRGYTATHPAFEAQWGKLEGLEYRTRRAAGLPGHVEVWEDSSRIGGFNQKDGNGDRIFTRVKFLQVDRTPRAGGGVPVYDATIEFLVEDPNFSGF